MDQFVPGVAPVVDDVGLGREHAGKPVIAQVLPDVLDRLSYGDFGGSRTKLMFTGRLSKVCRSEPSDLSSTRSVNAGLNTSAKVLLTRAAIWQTRRGGVAALRR